MMFEVKRIGDICKKVCSGGTPTSSNAAYYDGGIPWLNTNEVNFCNIYSTNKTISEEGLNHSAAKFIPVNSIIVAMYGVTAGKSAVAKIPLTTNQACCNLIIDEDKAYYQYVYHFLKLQSENLNKLANGGAQQNLNSIIIKKFKITLPSLANQHRIASILSAYDNLIENNYKRIRLLEQMPANLYKEWFVRFRFPGHEKAEFENGLPKGWRRAPLKTICEFERGKNITASEMISGNVPVISAGVSPSGYHNKSNVLGTSVTISSSGANAGFISIHYEDIWAADCSFISEESTKYIYYVYEVLNNMRAVVDNLQRGAAQPHVYPKDINRITIVVPDENIRAKANEKFYQLHKMIANLLQQNIFLSRQRDLLLPRLMSGKLEVKA
jgi:type I restriction enzyme S subunit